MKHLYFLPLLAQLFTFPVRVAFEMLYMLGTEIILVDPVT